MIIAMGGVRVLEILGSRKSLWTGGANPQLALTWPANNNATIASGHRRDMSIESPTANERLTAYGTQPTAM